MFVVNFEQISHVFFGVSIVDFEQVNVGKMCEKRYRVSFNVNLVSVSAQVLVIQQLCFWG